MNILIYEFDIFPYHDIIETLKKQGHHVDVLVFPLQSHVADPAFEQELDCQISRTRCDCIFTVNYITAVAKVCHNRQKPYISWCCDTPLLSMYHPSVNYPENTIYQFDKREVKRFLQQGTTTVQHLPLAATPKDLSHLPKKYLYDISFVGNLYDKNCYDEIMPLLPDYLAGYLDAAIEAQLQVQGGNLLPAMLTDELISDLEPYIHIEKDAESTAGIRLHVATSVLSYKVAALGRTTLLNMLARHFRGANTVHLFTTSDTSALVGIDIHPAVNYNAAATNVFAATKINLNMTVPNIESGIPLRVFDILSSGGFLLTDYQEELFEQFEPGKDFVIFEDIDDCIQKASYYLSHEEERLKIAKHGFQTLCKHHTYEKRLAKILPITGCQSLK